MLMLFLILLLLSFLLYFNNTSLVSAQTVSFYNQLKDSLRAKNYSPRLLVISTKRFKFHNKVQEKYAGASSRSRHLVGDALDFIVFDINKDGKSDSSDVDIAYKILDKQIIKSTGGIGTYRRERSFINKQMIHIDARGYKARWFR